MPSVPAEHDEAVADLQRLVEPRQFVRVERHLHDAGETSVRVQHFTGELDGRLAGVTADHRFADEQFVAVGVEMETEMLAIGQVERRRGRFGGRFAADPVFVDAADEKRELVGMDPLVDPVADVEPLFVLGIGGARRQQDLVDAGNDAVGVFLERAREIAGALDRRPLGVGAFLRQRHPQGQPGQRNQAADRQALRQQQHRLPAPPQPLGQPTHRAPHPAATRCGWRSLAVGRLVGETALADVGHHIHSCNPHRRCEVIRFR